MRRRIAALARIEMDGTEAMRRYHDIAAQMTYLTAWELAEAADEVEAVLSKRLKGHPLLMGIDVKVRARRVANRLRRAAEAMHGAGVEVDRFLNAYVRLFVAVARERARARR